LSLFSRAEKRGFAFLSYPATSWDDEFTGIARKTFAGRKVSRESAMHMISVYACQSLIADGISMLPVDHYNKVGGQKSLVDPLRSPRWISQPNPFQTSYSFWHRVIVSLLSDGNAFIYTQRNDRGDIIALYCIHPQAVWIQEGPMGDDRYEVNGVANQLDRTQILHIPAFAVPGRSRGLSPLDMAREAIGLGLTAEEYGARFFAQGTTMAGVIEHPGTPRPDEARLLRDMFKKTHAGVKNSHSVGVLTGGASFKPITLSPEQAQFLETRRFQKTEIALLYRVPAYLVDSSVTSTWGSGIEEQNKFFVDQTLMPWIVRIEQAVSTFLLPGSQYIKFNLDSRLRAKTKDRYLAYKEAINNGFMNADEIRALEDMDPLPDGLGQTFYMPLNLSDVAEEEEEEQEAEGEIPPDPIPDPPEAPPVTPPNPNDQGANDNAA
jgi:HK97 family phage portal protein